MMDRCETFRDCSTTIPISSLKVSYLYTIPCSFYDSSNEQNWMCELCTLLIYKMYKKFEFENGSRDRNKK